ncbi:keratin-associated protein 10-7-like isoform X2 [Belonocnema kinseyi]|uniref:keratin-associated protein 10-7-like isoform X2 n=1 Tax=Belonocnema kinseyi TaxID=2817044 RepID=UPI00143CC760|nr:keratin-associated protein 10-7-like isoform X2 [Belonocnema kinseyi]
MSECCSKKQTKKNEDCCADSSVCWTILCGKAQQFTEEGASCVINCKGNGNCCAKDSGFQIKCKGATGTCCEIDCGCCTVSVEKCEDDNGSCCKITCCADKAEDKKVCVLRCGNSGGNSAGNYCVINCDGKKCCVIKC